MARTKTPRSAWIDAGLVALAEHGVDEVRVEVLARDLGVTKGGFYGAFEGRADLLDAMVERWESAVTDDVVREVESAQDLDPRDRLRRLVAVIGRQDDPATRIDTEIGLRDWARRAPHVATVVDRVDAMRGTYLRDIFRGFCAEDEADVRTAIAMSVRLAGQTMTLGAGSRDPDEVARLVLQRLLE